MSDQQRFGDGQDNYAHGAQQAMNAAKQFGGSTGSAASGAAAESAAANSAGAAVKAGMEGGKAVSSAAVGAAAAGPWGAAVSAAWSLRNTLFKILIFLCLFLLILIIAVVSLPAIVTNNAFHLDPSAVDLTAPTDLSANFDDLAAVVSGSIQAGYDNALAQVEQIITDGGYDRTLSMDALINQALVSADYDTCYALAAYSVSMGQRGTTKADLQAKLAAVQGSMFSVTYTAAEKDVSVPADPAVPGSTPTTTRVQYVICTIHPFDQSVILSAFGVDTAAMYDQFQITCGDAITNMANALKMTLYGTLGNGMVPPITDAELNAYLGGLQCSDQRRELMRVALSLVGRVPYFWGGKSAPGWNEDWNTPRLVTSAGSSSTGTIRPYGLDCSGYTDWVYQTALGVTLYQGSWSQWDSTYAIAESDLLPGDIGFMAAPGQVPVNHVLLYAGKSAAGEALWVHCSSSYGGVALNSPDYVTQFRRISGVDLDAAMPAPAA